MRKTKKTLIALACLAALTAIAALCLLNPQPRYQGRRLGDWIAQLADDSVPPDKHEPAEQAVRHIGTNAIPFLLNWMRYEPSPTKAHRLDAVNRILGWLHRGWEIHDGRFAHLIGAQRALLALGQDARPAIPELIRLMNDPKAPQTAIHSAAALVCLRAQDTLPELLTVLTNRNHPAQGVVVANLYVWGTNALPAIPALIQCLQDTNRGIVLDALRTLSILRLEPALVEPALRSKLADPDASIREWASSGLSTLRDPPQPPQPPTQAPK